MKHITIVLSIAIILAAGAYCAEAPAGTTPVVKDAAAAITSPAGTTITAAPAVKAQKSKKKKTVAPASVTTTAEVTAATLNASAPAPVSTAAAVAATPVSTPIEGVAPPALEGTYEEPPAQLEPTPESVPEEAQKINYRKSKHVTIEQTVFTPSQFGTRFGYFINEYWRVMAEYATISNLISKRSNERNDSWAINANFMPSDDDWAPFYGAGYFRLDFVNRGTDPGSPDKIRSASKFSGGYFVAGLSYITDSILTFTIEFDLLGGYMELYKIDETDPTKIIVPVRRADMAVNFGASVGLAF